MEFADGGDL